MISSFHKSGSTLVLIVALDIRALLGELVPACYVWVCFNAFLKKAKGSGLKPHLQESRGRLNRPPERSVHSNIEAWGVIPAKLWAFQAFLLRPQRLDPTNPPNPTQNPNPPTH